MTDRFIDISAERTLLATIVRYGKDAYIDATTWMSASDLTLPVNRAIFTCISELSENENCQSFDIESIKMRAKVSGLEKVFEDKKTQEYLAYLESMHSQKDNVQLFARQLRKYSVLRDLYKRYKDGQKYLEEITGNEPLSEIISNAENKIVDYISGHDSGESLISLVDGMAEYVAQLEASEPVDQVGLPTGFPQYDLAVGGGTRKAGVYITGARTGVGKTYLADNKLINVARQGVPCLLLDSEMTKEQQLPRILGILSGVPIFYIENRKFKNSNYFTQQLRDAAEEAKSLDITHQSIAGLTTEEALAVARRWIVKHVGFNDDGSAKDCYIVYDYLKLTGGQDLDKAPEWVLLGLQISAISNFAIKYKVPVEAFVQFNRQGISENDGSIIAGSDRILWLCSAMGVLRDKDPNDTELGCGKDFGGKKLSVMKTRYGAGLQDSDYINVKTEIRPDVTIDKGTGRMKEGITFYDAVGGEV